MNPNILSLLGLAKRGGMLAVGEEPVEAVARAKDARVLLAASDAAANTLRRVGHFAEAGACLWLRIPFTKEQLGRAVGRTSCAVVALTDIGFAASIVRRMAEEDPAYGDAAEKLDIKARRAAQRREEQKSHDKNPHRGNRTGKAASSQEKPEGPPPVAASRTISPVPSKSRTEPVQKAAARKFRRPFRGERPRAKPANPYTHSHPVKKGKGSFRKKDGS